MQLQYFFLKTICFLYQDIYSSCSTSYICNYICLPATPFNGKKYTCSNTKKYPKNVTRLLTINTVISLMHVPLVYIHRTWNLFFRLNWWKIQLNVIIWITLLSICNNVNNTKIFRFINVHIVCIWYPLSNNSISIYLRLQWLVEETDLINYVWLLLIF